MRNKILLLGSLLLLLANLQVSAQYGKQTDGFKRCFVGSTLALAGNLLPNDKPHFIQVNLGYRLTGRDVLSVELKTWRYHQSLGIPYGDAYNDEAEKFPGHVSEKGFALAYQRYLWKGLYTAVHVMSAWQSFVNESGEEIDDGFQIFNTYRLGYHIKLFDDRFFFEPSFAVTHRPYHTEMPDSFRQTDSKWTKWFFGEPGLHIGINF